MSAPVVVILTPPASGVLSGAEARILVRAVDSGSGVSDIRISLSDGSAEQTLYQRSGVQLDGDHLALLNTLTYANRSYTVVATALDALRQERKVSRSLAVSNPKPEPVVGPIRSFVDTAQGHSIDGNKAQYRNTTIQRIGDRLYFIYRTLDRRVFIRPWDRGRQSFEPAIRVFGQIGAVNEGVHQYPSLLRTANGELVALWPWGDSVASSPGQRDRNVATVTIPPLLRVIPDLARPATWSQEGPGLPLRDQGARWKSLSTAYYGDIMGVWEPFSGITHVLGEATRLGPLDGVFQVDGLARGYFRINADRSIEGPYLLTLPKWGEPLRADVPGNVFTKGKLALGKEIAGPRSLHLVWSIRNPFAHAGVSYQHNYNLYYAKSTDGGFFWRSFSGAMLRSKFQGIQWNDPRFLIYEGDLQEDAPVSWDIDPTTGAPLFLIAKYRAGSGAAEIFGHADSVSLSEPDGPHKGVWDLFCHRWSGSGWMTLPVDTKTNYFLKQLHVAIASNGTVLVVREQPIAYNYSLTNGITWAGWQTISSNWTDDRNHQLYVDPLHPNLAEIAWGQANILGSGWVEIQLAPDL